MASEVSATATQVAVDRKHNEEVIVAEASLIGEHFLAKVRLGMFAIWVTSMVGGAMISGDYRGRDVIRTAVSVLYVISAVMAFRGINAELVKVRAGTIRASVKSALYWPVMLTLIDFAMVSMMQWRNSAVGRYYPTGFVAASAFFIAFALVRFSTLHVVLSATVASVCFVVMDRFIIGRPSSVLETAFVIATYGGLGIIIGFANRTIRNMFVDVRRRQNLSRFLPRQVADRVMRDSGMLKPSQREVTILFSDIRDFTSMSENMQPAELLKFLDEYFGHMGQIVKGHDGIVNKFLGDGMLAVWGAPDHDDAHAEKALKAALDMRKRLVELNQQRATEGKPPIRTGIGIHTGIVAAGMLGGADQHEYTVIGDAVNLASRIEGLTKTLAVDLLVSESTHRQLHDRYECVRAGEEHVKGRSEPVVVFTVSSSVLDGVAARAAALHAVN